MNNYKAELKEVFEKKRFLAQRAANLRSMEALERVPLYGELLRRQRLLGVSLVRGEITREDFRKQSAQIDMQIDQALEKYGYQRGNFLPQYECVLCKDTGYVNGRMCSCLKRAYANEYAKQSGLIAMLDRENFSTFDDTLFCAQKNERNVSKYDIIMRAKEACEDFVKTFDADAGNLFITGPVGTGKTFLANCIAKALLERNKYIYYFTAPDLISKIMDSEFSHVQDEEFLEDLAQCDLLIVDDLGAERASEYAVSSVCALIDKRLRNGKKIVLTTNLNFAELKAHYSERLASRIIGSFKGISLKGLDDLRLLKRAQHSREAQ